MTMDAGMLDERAREILRQNDRGGYTVPTDGLYPYQWNWDSAFAAWGLAQFDLDRAWTEIETLLSGQWPNGMVPHILVHAPDPGYFPGPDVWGTDGHGPVPSSGISQPPVAASFVRRIWDRDRTAGDARVRALYPKLLSWHRWFMEWRSEDGAICITHPWEAGRDNAPDWDGAMAGLDPVDVGAYTRRDTAHVNADMRPTKYDYDRYVWLVQFGKRLGWDEAAMRAQAPFRVADPGRTFILLAAMRDLATLGEAIGEDISQVRRWIAALEDGAATLWNEDLQSYDARDIRTGTFAGCVSNAAFLCWCGGLDDDRMIGQVNRVWNVIRCPVPSHDPESPRFDPRRYWRGPTWAIMNALIGTGMEQAGLGDYAGQLRRDTAELIAANGFAEYFDPTDGTPAGGGSFTWTAAVWLAWASPNAGRG